MTTLTLTKTLLDTDLSNIPAAGKIVNEYTNASIAAYTLASADSFDNGGFFNTSEFVLSNNGKTKTYTDPSAGYYQTKGSAVITFKEADQAQIVSASINLSKLTRINAEGTFATGLSSKFNQKLNDSNVTIEFSGKDMSFTGSDGSKWLIKSNTSYKVTTNIDSNNSNPKANWSISSIASYDSNGNGLIYKGDFKINLLDQEYSGTVKSFQMVIGGKTLNVNLKDLPETPFTALMIAGTLNTFSDLMPYAFLRGNDTLTVSSTDKPDGPIKGYAGNDKITGSNTDDFLYGGDGLGTNSGNDTLNGVAGNDYLYGEDGNDTINGGDGNDELWGDKGNDTLNGGAGDDYLVAEDGNDMLNGGAGNDGLYGGDGNDTLNGGDGNDYFNGQDGNDTLNGGAGNDILYGAGGVNKLDGGKGNDFLAGVGLKDTLTGGAGQDFFYIYEQANEVIVTDFKVKDDLIYLENKIVNASNFYKAAGAKNAIADGQYYGYDTKSGTLYYDSDGIGGNDAIAIATLIGKPDISVDNFTTVLPPT